MFLAIILNKSGPVRSYAAPYLLRKGCIAADRAMINLKIQKNKKVF
jgi:hypothetical protein